MGWSQRGVEEGGFGGGGVVGVDLYYAQISTVSRHVYMLLIFVDLVIFLPFVVAVVVGNARGARPVNQSIHKRLFLWATSACVAIGPQ